MPNSAPTVNSYYAIDSRRLFISWSAPPAHQQNGIIRHYNISLVETETGSNFHYTTANTNHTISLLHPAYSYQIEISAITIGAGPRSVSVVLQMPEDGRNSIM